MAVRLAWHASGTFDKNDGSGGSDGATMRFAPEREDGANAGLGIERDILQPVKRAVPEVSTADIWTLAGAQAVEVCGGPKINHAMGRKDVPRPPTRCKSTRREAMTQVGVAQATEGPTRVLMLRESTMGP